VNFSGGMYSLVLLHICLKILKNIRIIYIDTTITLPECDDYIKNIQNKLGFQFVILKREDKNFWDIAKRWGFPRSNFRWCMSELKSVPLELFNKSIEGTTLHLTGTSTEGSTIRKKIYNIRGCHHFNYSISSYVLHPLLFWRRENVIKYLKKYELDINPCYDLYGHGGNCYYCPFYKNEIYYKNLAKIHSKLFKNIVMAEKCMNKGGAAIYLGRGKKLYISKLV